MEDTITQAYSLAKLGVVALVVVLQIIAIAMQVRTRPYSPIGLALRSMLAIGGFVALLIVTGVSINWLWGVVFGVIGFGLGWLAGRSSKRSLDPKGRRVIKRSPWPALVNAIAYVLAMVALLYGTVGIFSVAMLLVLFGAMMTDGAVLAEIMPPRGSSAAPVTAAPVAPRR